MYLAVTREGFAIQKCLQSYSLWCMHTEHDLDFSGTPGVDARSLVTRCGICGSIWCFECQPGYWQSSVEKQSETFIISERLTISILEPSVLTVEQEAMLEVMLINRIHLKSEHHPHHLPAGSKSFSSSTEYENEIYWCTIYINLYKSLARHKIYGCVGCGVASFSPRRWLALCVSVLQTREASPHPPRHHHPPTSPPTPANLAANARPDKASDLSHPPWQTFTASLIIVQC